MLAKMRIIQDDSDEEGQENVSTPTQSMDLSVFRSTDTTPVSKLVIKIALIKEFTAFNSRLFKKICF